jgi:hypothetical protein
MFRTVLAAVAPAGHVLEMLVAFEGNDLAGRLDVDQRTLVDTANEVSRHAFGESAERTSIVTWIPF